MKEFPRDLVVELHSYGGGCPVQGEGTVLGFPFYFRSRGELTSVEINYSAIPYAEKPNYTEWRRDCKTFNLSVDLFEWPEAGYISEDEAYKFMVMAFNAFKGFINEYCGCGKTKRKKKNGRV